MPLFWASLGPDGLWLRQAVGSWVRFLLESGSLNSVSSVMPSVMDRGEVHRGMLHGADLGDD